MIQYMRDEFNMHDQTSIFSSISSFSSFVVYTIVLTVNNHDHSWMKATFNHYSLLKRIQNLLEIMFWYRFGHSNNVIRIQNRFSAKMRGFNPSSICLTSFILDDLIKRNESSNSYLYTIMLRDGNAEKWSFDWFIKT